VVGVSFDASGNIHSFLWENGGPMVDLSTLIPPEELRMLKPNWLSSNDFESELARLFAEFAL
jgi:probable HAF family extracellular repeat protein